MKKEAQATKFRIGARVTWMWSGRPIHGKVVEVHFERVQKSIKGKLITRIGSPERPAYLVVSDAGNEALKLATELQKVELRSKAPVPKLFRD